MDNISDNWGQYKFSDYPKVEWDSFQSFHEDGSIFGYRVHVIPSRGNRPRENKFPVQQSSLESSSKKSLLLEIAKGNEVSIPIAGDTETFVFPEEEPRKLDLTKYNAISIVNKFSPTKITGGDAEGISILSFPTTKIIDLSNPELNGSLLINMKTAISSLIGKKYSEKELRSTLIFFNIGSSSGASLQQLHSQTYIIPKSTGLITYNIDKSYNQSLRMLNRCLVCDFARKEIVNDHIGQSLSLKDLTIIEDNYAKMIMSNAPIRPFSIRIIPKKHIPSFHQSDYQLLNSIGRFFAIADRLILEISKPTKLIKKDRTIAFRQSYNIDRDFHYFIDVMPSIPLGGAETIDCLTISTIDSSQVAKEMKELLTVTK